VVAVVTREVQGALLVAMGGVAMRLVQTGLYLRYLKPGMGPWLAVTGVALAILGVLTLLGGRRRRRAASAGPADGSRHPPEDGDAHHATGHGAPRVAWLLLLPVLTLSFVAPQALGSYAANRQSVRIPEPSSPEFSPLPEEVDGAVPMRFLDFLTRAVYDEKRSLEGVRVRMSGFAMPDIRDARGFLLARFLLACCAADGRAMKLDIVGWRGKDPPADSWLVVEGMWVPRDPSGEGDPQDFIPQLRLITWDRIPAPRDPYEGA
jgi:uncharacterized repeat protein (TIGR03943 family)